VTQKSEPSQHSEESDRDPCTKGVVDDWSPHFPQFGVVGTHAHDSSVSHAPCATSSYGSNNDFSAPFLEDFESVDQELLPGLYGNLSPTVLAGTAAPLPSFPWEQLYGNESNFVTTDETQQHLGANINCPALNLSVGGTPQTNHVGIAQYLTADNINAYTAAGGTSNTALPIYDSNSYDVDSGLLINNSHSFGNSMALAESTNSDADSTTPRTPFNASPHVQETGANSQACPHCGKIIGRPGDLERHLKSHDPADERKCAFCPKMKRASRPDKYKEHLIKVHKMDVGAALKHSLQWV
jgi:hypothetical protein